MEGGMYSWEEYKHSRVEPLWSKNLLIHRPTIRSKVWLWTWKRNIMSSKYKYWWRASSCGKFHTFHNILQSPLSISPSCMQNSYQIGIFVTIWGWRWQYVGICVPHHQTMCAQVTKLPKVFMHSLPSVFIFICCWMLISQGKREYSLLFKNVMFFFILIVLHTNQIVCNNLQQNFFWFLAASNKPNHLNFNRIFLPYSFVEK